MLATVVGSRRAQERMPVATAIEQLTEVGRP